MPTKADEAAYMILRILSKKSGKEVTLFRAMYEEFFPQTRVPALQKFNDIVVVDRIQAMEYLKNKHNFYTKAELEEALKEAADDIQNVRTSGEGISKLRSNS